MRTNIERDDGSINEAQQLLLHADRDFQPMERYVGRRTVAARRKRA